MTGDGHKLTQTAFRLPEGLLAWLREQAEREHRTRTAVVRDALEAYKASQPRLTALEASALLLASGITDDAEPSDFGMTGAQWAALRRAQRKLVFLKG